MKYKKTQFSIIVAITLFVVFGVVGNSEAEITSVIGNIFNGENMTITGSGFGNGPNVIFFDDFEKGENNAEIMTGSDSSQVGEINHLNGVLFPYYTNSTSVSGSLAFQADISENWMESAEVSLPENTRELFVSWWLYLPAGDNYPGETDPMGINWKQMWVLGESTTDDDLVIPSKLPTSWFINGNDNNPGYNKYITVDFQKGEWKRLSVWLKGGYQNDGSVYLWELDDPNGVLVRNSDDGVDNLKEGGAWESVGINRYARPAPNSHPTFDDVYIAAGDHSRARVEIGNNQTYEDCTKLTVATPSEWSDTEITATFWQGQFAYGDNAFVFVVDEDGNVSTGYPISFDSGVLDTTPPFAPSGLSVD